MESASWERVQKSTAMFRSRGGGDGIKFFIHHQPNNTPVIRFVGALWHVAPFVDNITIRSHDGVQ